MLCVNSVSAILVPCKLTGRGRLACRAGYYTSLLSVASCLCCHPLAHLLTAPMRPASEQGASSSSGALHRLCCLCGVGSVHVHCAVLQSYALCSWCDEHLLV